MTSRCLVYPDLYLSGNCDKCPIRIYCKIKTERKRKVIACSECGFVVDIFADYAGEITCVCGRTLA
jgi:hypothetical protein